MAWGWFRYSFASLFSFFCFVSVTHQKLSEGGKINKKWMEDGEGTGSRRSGSGMNSKKRWKRINEHFMTVWMFVFIGSTSLARRFLPSRDKKPTRFRGKILFHLREIPAIFHLYRTVLVRFSLFCVNFDVAFARPALTCSEVVRLLVWRRNIREFWKAELLELVLSSVQLLLR